MPNLIFKIPKGEKLDEQYYDYYAVYLSCITCKDSGKYAIRRGTTIRESLCPKCNERGLTINL